MNDTPLWSPNAATIAASNLTAFARQVETDWKADLPDYWALLDWSRANQESFFRSVWRFGEVVAETRGDRVLVDGDKMPGARWFPDAKLNFAENLLKRRDDAPALIFQGEHGPRREVSWAGLYDAVSRCAQALRADGVASGDRVVGFMPNIPETVVAMLAAASLGATWSSCSPDFGIKGVMDRFGQIEPTVLITADGYHYGGKQHDSLGRVRDIVKQLPSLKRLVVVPFVATTPDLDGLQNATLWQDYLGAYAAGEIAFIRLPFDHPLYIMYSSGTTGVPKCIVHSAGGTLIQHRKEHLLHVDLKQEDTLFYFTTCGWMMWNWLISGLASGATLVLYDGSPFAPQAETLIDMIDSERISIFGTSAKYIAALEKAEVKPRQSHQLERLKTILSTGSPLSHESFRYVYRDFKADVCLASISGGTDIISCFVLGNPCLPVYEGELQCLGLGMAVEIRDANGHPVTGEKGELVCTRPFPSCPVYFWNDPDNEKFLDAYFATWPGIWAHGDYGETTEHQGVIIHGRSDAVLNPGGVRIGTAEIYRQVEKVDSVIDALCIGQEWEDDVRIVLFVVLRPGLTLDETLIKEIRTTIRANTTPRHVPAKIIQVPDIPRTISGKIVELAVRNIVHNKPVKNIDALANPAALDYFKNLPDLQS